MDGKIYGLNPLTSSKVWEFDTNGPISTSPTVQNGKLYIGNRDEKFFAINITNGTLAWSYPFTVTIPQEDSATYLNNALIVSPAAVSVDGSKVYFAA